MLLSTYRRAGEPVAVAFGPSPDGGGLQVGLLMVAPGITLHRVTFRPANDPQGRRTTLIWPESYRELAEPRVFTNVRLEAA